MVQKLLHQHPKCYTLQSVVVELGAAQPGKPPATLGRAIHAQVLEWLSLGNPEVAEAVHTAQMPPLSLSGLLGNRRRRGTQPGDKFSIRISLLNGNLLEPLLTGIQAAEHQPVVLGKFPFKIRNYFAFPGTHRLAGSTDYSSLAQSPPLSDLQLNFLSPTSFKQKQDIQPFPLPELVFGSLQRRWNSFAPEDLKFPSFEWQGLVSAYDLKTQALRLEGGAEIGTQG
ncbi:MAG: CRISPR system precrRNA processing endoribonuclease RAMP protein Cas6, partial [Kamptonema sp. SIO1D9]|nr:CRISPR system precrRNA processing endoribonuclease RAMP protein Cas6 [Kamptonema sp. SIO1D9]